MAKTPFHTQFSGRVRVQTGEDPGKSRTHQSFKKEVDINNIVKRHTDQRIPLPSAGLVYADVSELTDYREALDNVTLVRKVFDRLPSSSRAYFDNDAAIFLDWSFENEAETVDALMQGPPMPPQEAPPAPPAVPETPPDPPPPAEPPASAEPQ